jgi:hypothetical protein
MGPNTKQEIVAITEFNKSTAGGHEGSALVDTVEVRASTVGEIEQMRDAIPPTFMRFVEIPIDQDPTLLLEGIRSLGVRSKVRTGGITTDSFPSGVNLARFISTCTEKKIAFKATAGLHHPLRAQYRLTYEPEGPRGTMFGFLNLLVAAAVASSGGDLTDIQDALDEQSSHAFRFSETGISWGRFTMSSNDIASVREELALSFGSCSFTEPIEGLTSLGLL